MRERLHDQIKLEEPPGSISHNAELEGVALNADSASIGVTLHKVSRQGAVVLFTRGAALALGLASTVFLSRFLGPTGFGEFRLGSVVVQLVTAFCVLGLDRALFRALPILEARGQSGGRALLVKSGSVVLALSLFFSLILVATAPILAVSYFHSPGMTNILRAFCFQVPVLALFRFLTGAVTGAKRIDVSSKITNILSPALFVFLLALALLFKEGIFGAITARVVAQLVAVICLVVFLTHHYPKVGHAEAAADDGTFKNYVLLSLPLFVIGLGYQLLNKMDAIMLGHFASETDVGLYSVAFKVSALVLIGPEILLPIVAPLFSHFSETREKAQTEALFATVTKWLSYSALLIFTCIAVFRVELLNVFGKGFNAGATVLLILGAGQLANAATGPTGVLLTMTGKQKLELSNVVSMVVLNFFLNLFLIPKMGGTGAALATALSITAINVLKLVQVYRLFQLQAYNLRYLKGIIAIGGAGLITYLIRAWLLSVGCSSYAIMPLGGMTFIVTSVAGFWLLGLDQEDKMALAALRRRRGRV